MKPNAIEKYIAEVLKPQLATFGVTDKYIKTVTKTIKSQMQAFVYYWDDEDFRKAYFVTVCEEGLFYEPNADDDIRNFVVLTVRNSEIEWLQTANHTLAGLKLPYDDSYVKHITSKAIEFFKDMNFSKLSESMEEPPTNIYSDMADKYPAAFLALRAISSIDKLVIGYRGAKEAPIPDLGILPLETNAPKEQTKGTRSDFTRVMSDGISFSIDQPLLDMLQYSADNKLPFTSDSFKSVSRNIEKLMLILEFTLRNKIPFVTSNYFIVDEYIEKREKIIRAGHDRNDMIRNWKNTKGLGEHHAHVLKRASDGMK